MLSWSATHPVPILEGAVAVIGPYVPVAVTPTEADGIATVQPPITGKQQFFRLRMP
jgi:hypothetical protein